MIYMISYAIYKIFLIIKILACFCRNRIRHEEVLLSKLLTPRLCHRENCHYFYSDECVFHILTITLPPYNNRRPRSLSIQKAVNKIRKVYSASECT